MTRRTGTRSRRHDRGHRVGRIGLALSAGCFYVLASLAAPASGAEYPGVDETVVEKIAREHGREARTPLINSDRGDILLFAFLSAGAAGGFAAGYYWRVLTEQRTKRK